MRLASLFSTIPVIRSTNGSCGNSLDIEAMTGNIRTLGRPSRGNGLLERLPLERKRFDGRVQNHFRGVYDLGDGAAIWLYDPRRSRVVLARQFRLPFFFGKKP